MPLRASDLYVGIHGTALVTTDVLTQEDRLTLIELEEAMWREERRFDPEFQEQHFASDFVEFGRSGRTYTREQVIRTDVSPIQATLPLSNLELRVLDVHMVLITCDSQVTFDGTVEHAHRSSIWSRTGGHWVMRFHQGTPYQPSPSRPGGQGAAQPVVGHLARAALAVYAAPRGRGVRPSSPGWALRQAASCWRSRSNPPVMTPSIVPRDIAGFFENYRDAFNALDGHAVARMYAEPSGIAQDGRYTHWPTRQPIAENMGALCTLYRDKGFIRADFEPKQFIDQGEMFAVADLQWRIDWNGGQNPWYFGTTYNLVRTSEGWKILLCTAYSEAALFTNARNPGAA